MTEYPTIRLTLSRRFWEDHTNRDLPGGVLIRTMSRLVEVDANRWDVLELLSDAEHYAFNQDGHMRADFAGLIAAAKTVVKKLSAVELPAGAEQRPSDDYWGVQQAMRRQFLDSWERTCGCGRTMYGSEKECFWCFMKSDAVS